METQLHSFLTSAQSTRLGCFALGKEHQVPTEYKPEWPQSWSEHYEEEITSCPYWESCYTSIAIQSTVPTTLSWLTRRQ